MDASESQAVNRFNQIVRNFFRQAALIILRSRVFLPQTLNRNGEVRINKWFNIQIDETAAFDNDFSPWNQPHVRTNRPPVMVVEIFVNSEELWGAGLEIRNEGGETKESGEESAQHYSGTRERGSNVVLERWHIALNGSPDTMGHAWANTMPITYKRCVIFFRSLFTIVGLLPVRTLGNELRIPLESFLKLLRYRIYQDDSNPEEGVPDALPAPSAGLNLAQKASVNARSQVSPNIPAESAFSSTVPSRLSSLGGSKNGDANIPTTCTNCSTQETPLWHHSPEGRLLCNACGLFLKLHGVVRPLSLKSEITKKRKRRSDTSLPATRSTLSANKSSATLTTPFETYDFGSVDSSIGSFSIKVVHRTGYHFRFKDSGAAFSVPFTSEDSLPEPKDRLHENKNTLRENLLDHTRAHRPEYEPVSGSLPNLSRKDDITTHDLEFDLLSYSLPNTFEEGKEDVGGGISTAGRPSRGLRWVRWVSSESPTECDDDDDDDISDFLKLIDHSLSFRPPSLSTTSYGLAQDNIISLSKWSELRDACATISHSILANDKRPTPDGQPPESLHRPYIVPPHRTRPMLDSFLANEERPTPDSQPPESQHQPYIVPPHRKSTRPISDSFISNDDGPLPPEFPRQTSISKSCQYCRRRKIRCHGFDSLPDSRCTNCVRFHQECIFAPVSSQAHAFVPAHIPYRHLSNMGRIQTGSDGRPVLKNSLSSEQENLEEYGVFTPPSSQPPSEFWRRRPSSTSGISPLRESTRSPRVNFYPPPLIQQTAIVCEYCRRRNIRCYGFDSSLDGRCTNCARLDKDCSLTSSLKESTRYCMKCGVWRNVRNGACVVCLIPLRPYSHQSDDGRSSGDGSHFASSPGARSRRGSWVEYVSGEDNDGKHGKRVDEKKRRSKKVKRFLKKIGAKTESEGSWSPPDSP